MAFWAHYFFRIKVIKGHPSTWNAGEEDDKWQQGFLTFHFEESKWLHHGLLIYSIDCYKKHIQFLLLARTEQFQAFPILLKIKYNFCFSKFYLEDSKYCQSSSVTQHVYHPSAVMNGRCENICFPYHLLWFGQDGWMGRWIGRQSQGNRTREVCYPHVHQTTLMEGDIWWLSRWGWRLHRVRLGVGDVYCYSDTLPFFLIMYLYVCIGLMIPAMFIGIPYTPVVIQVLVCMEKTCQGNA